MSKTDESGMWNLVMFDLPVKTKPQRRVANQFRHLLMDLGWSREQYSVYVRYVPTGTSVAPELIKIQRAIPRNGRVEIVVISDRQWSKAMRFFNASPEEPHEAPEQLTIF